MEIQSTSSSEPPVELVSGPPAVISAGKMKLDVASGLIYVGSTGDVVERADPPIFQGGWGYFSGGRTNTGVVGSGIFAEASASQTPIMGAWPNFGQVMDLQANNNSHYFIVGAGAAWQFVCYPAQRPWLLVRVLVRHIVDVRLFVGLTMDAGVQGGGADPSQNCAFFNFDPALSAKWNLYTRGGTGLDRQVLTGSPDVTANTVYYLRLRFNAAGDVIAELFDSDMVLLGTRTILASGGRVPIASNILRFIGQLTSTVVADKNFAIFECGIRCER